MGIHGYTRVYMGILGYTRVCIGIHGYTRVYMGILGYTRVYMDILGYTRVYNTAIRSDEGLTLETSAFQSLYGGQFTLSTPLINQIFVY